MSGVYNGGSGSTGEGASHDREQRLDDSGASANHQAFVYSEVRSAGREGITSREIIRRFDLDINSVSPPLTNLHIAGDVACLVERRGNCHIYVLPDHVDGRRLRPPGRHNAISEQVRGDVRELMTWLDRSGSGTYPAAVVDRLRNFGGLA